MSDSVYTSRIKKCYHDLGTNKIITNQIINAETMKHFEDCINETLPTNDAESDFNKTIKALFYCNPAGFEMCAKSSQYLFLLVDAKTIVTYFNINKLIFIKWIDDRYLVEINRACAEPYQKGKFTKKNTYEPKVEKKQSKEKYNKKGATLADLAERIKNLEMLKDNDMSKLELTEPTEPLGTTDSNNWGDQ